MNLLVYEKQSDIKVVLNTCEHITVTKTYKCSYNLVILQLINIMLKWS